MGEVDGAADDLGVLGVDGQPGHEGPVDLQLADGEPAQVDEGGVAGAEVVQGHLDAVPGQRVEGVGRALGVLQEDVLGDLELERSRGNPVPGQPGGHRPREAGGVHVARGDVDRDRHEQALGAPVGDLAERRLQDVLGEVGHQPGGLGDGYELVRRHPAALGVHPAHQRLQAGDLPVEADLGLVVQLDLVGVQRPAQVAEETEPVRRVGVPLGLVDLDPGAVPLRLVHRHVGAAQQPFGVQRVVGEDGDARAGLQHQGEPVQVHRGAEGADEAAGDPGRRRGGVGDGQ